MYYSNAKGKNFSDKSIIGIRKKAIKELRDITKGGTFFMGMYSHHVMIFDAPFIPEESFMKAHWIGNVGRDIIAEDDWKTIRKETFTWYDRKKGEKYVINKDGTILRKWQ